MSFRVYNRYLDLLFEIDRYQSLQFTRSYHGIGDFELHVNRYINGADHLEKGNLIALNKQNNKVGIILSKEIALDEAGKETENFKLTGYTLDGLMQRRITVPPSHTSHDRISGSAEAVMKHYVYKNFIDTTKERQMPFLEIADNLSRGRHLQYESRYKTVSDELENISISTGLGWGIFADFNTKKLIFDVVEAKDLTQHNTQGNNPVFFSPEFETIKSQTFIDSDNELRNVGFVGGQGEGVERKIVEIGDAYGWDRIETFIDARDISDEDEETEEELTEEEVEELLIERGHKKMSEMETIFTLEAEILTPVTRKYYEYTHEGYAHPGQPIQSAKAKNQALTPFEYEKDFDLGDRVEVVNKSWNLMMTAPITEVTEIYEPGGFRLDATFGRKRPTLISKLKDKFDELEGVEKQEAPERVSVINLKEAKKYAREQDEYVRQDAEEYTEGYTYPKNEIDEKDESVYQDSTVYTDILMQKAQREIDDTKARITQAEKDLGKADGTIKQALEDIENLEGQLEELPDWSESIEQINTTLTKVNDDIDTAQDKIDSVTEDKDGQTVLKGTLITNEIIAEMAILTGVLKGAGATIEELTTKDMHALRAIIEDATIKGQLDANTATMLGLTTKQMTAINAIIENATITGNLNASDAIFQKGRFNEATIVDAIIENVRGLTGTFADVTVTDGDFNLQDAGTKIKYSATPRRNLIKDHSFELIPSDPDSMTSSSITYNWLEIKPNSWPFEDSAWERVGSPKVAVQFAPASVNALPIYGDKAIVVRNSNYVRQYIHEGVGAGSVYTVSGFFKRQWNAATGGIPLIQIWHVNALGNRVSRIVNSTFPAVKSDYSVERHATTFTVPSNFQEGESLEVIISGSNDRWIHCDGVQMVEGNRPSVYEPEDSTWMIAKGMYRPVSRQLSLWNGIQYPSGSQTATPQKKLSECMNGWIVGWMGYVPGSGATDAQIQYTYIPKYHGHFYGGKGVRVQLGHSGGSARSKYIYVHDDKITGHNTNSDSPNNSIAMFCILEW